MSYLSEVLHRQITVKQGLSKTFGYLKGKFGLSVTDEEVDAAVAAVDKATDDATKIFVTLIEAKYPAIPVEVATIAVTTALNVLDAAAAGVGNVIKEANDQPAPVALPG